MLQLSNQARLKVQPAFICSSCRHLLSRHATTTATTTSPPPSAAAATAAATSTSAPTPLVQPGVARSSSAKAKAKRKASRSGRPTKDTKLWQQTLDVLKDIQAGRLVLTPVANKEVPKEATPEPAGAAEPAGEETASGKTSKKSKKAKNKAKANDADKNAAQAEADAKAYHPAQLEGALKVLRSVLSKEFAGDNNQKAEAKAKELTAGEPNNKAENGEKAEKGEKTAKVKQPKGNKEQGKGSAKEGSKKQPGDPVGRHLAALKAGLQDLPVPKPKAGEPKTVSGQPALKDLVAVLHPVQADFITKNPKNWDEKQTMPEPPEPAPVPLPKKKKKKTEPKKTPQSKSEPKMTPRRVSHGERLFRTVTPGLINPKDLHMVPVEKQQPPVPKLSYGLDRVLFNPGVYHLQDPRTRVYNFDPYLARIMPVKEFDFSALKQYVTSSKDVTLIDMAAKHNRKYTGSTSSMTAMLAHFHYLLSAWRPVNPVYQSSHYEVESTNFSAILRAPAAVFLHHKDGVYAIDADKEFDTANILSMLGKSMEKLLTLPKEEFELYRRSKSDQLSDEEKNGPEAYHYTTLGDFMMRSQLDAFDPRIPGTGMFDLKTRAVVPIRFGVKQIKKGLGYEIRDRVGQWESYEREYYDMVRNAFLKYSLQVRMGRMDGIFVAFHNTERIFGFQYIPLAEMDHTVHGTPNTLLGDREFKLSLHLLNELLDRATAKFPARSLRLYFETRKSDPPFMYAFAEPVTPEKIEKIQGKNRKQIEEFEHAMMTGLDGVVKGEKAGVPFVEEVEELEDEERLEQAEEAEAYGEGEETNLAAWEDVMDRVEEVLEDEEQGVTSVRESIEAALQQSGLLRTSDSKEARSYLDALLKALTSSEEGPAAAGEVEAADAEGGVASAEDVEPSVEDAETVSKDAEPSVEGAEPLVKDVEPSVEGQSSEMVDYRPAEAATGQDGKPEEPEDQEESGLKKEVEEDDQTRVKLAQDGDASELPNNLNQRSLKDLIVRLASQVRSVPRQQQPQETEEDVTEDAMKLRKFESILSELIAKNLELNKQQQQQQHPSTGDEQTSSPTADDLLATNSDQPVTAPPSSSWAEGLLKPEQEAAQEEALPPEDLLGMILTVRNKINGRYVERPLGMHPEAEWDVEYVVEEIGDKERAQNLYWMLKKRRERAFARDRSEKLSEFDASFRAKLAKYSNRGKAFRAQETARNVGKPVHVYGVDEPLQWTSVFGEEGSDDFPDGLGYKTWRPEEHGVGAAAAAAAAAEGEKEVERMEGEKESEKQKVVVRWEDSQARADWAQDLAGRQSHVPQFEITSSYYKDNPAKQAEVQMMESQKEAREARRAAAKASPESFGKPAKTSSSSKSSGKAAKAPSGGPGKGEIDADHAERREAKAMETELMEGVLMGGDLSKLVEEKEKEEEDKGGNK